MADKRCENGHFIDESWDLCPYCPQDRRVERVASAPRTVAQPPASSERPAIRLVDPAPRAEPPSRTMAAPRADAQPEKAPRRFVVAWLVGINGTTRGESFPIRLGRNVIGRAPSSDVLITDDQASGHHADLVFRPEEKRFILMDHNSTNGTFVNGDEIAPRRDLNARDVIRIGKQKFMFVPLCDENFSWDEGDLLR